MGSERALASASKGAQNAERRMLAVAVLDDGGGSASGHAQDGDQQRAQQAKCLPGVVRNYKICHVPTEGQSRHSALEWRRTT